MTKQEALKELRNLIKKHNVVLSWDSSPISFEELIIARDGPEIIKEIDKAIETV